MYTKYIIPFQKKLTSVFLSVFFLLLSIDVNAQCAMCRAALETEETGVPAEAVNDGIVYLMVFPYLLLFVIGWAVYRIVKNKKKASEAK